MINQPVFKDAVTRTIDLLRATFADYFHAYFEGNPDNLKQSLLPCVAVYLMDTEFAITNTGGDENTHTLMIRLILNKKDDMFSQISDPNVKFTERRLRLLVEAQDPNTGYYLPNTLAYALRTNWTQGQHVINNIGKANYVVTPRPEGVITSEALITLTLTDRVTVLNRA